MFSFLFLFSIHSVYLCAHICMCMHTYTCVCTLYVYVYKIITLQSTEHGKNANCWVFLHSLAWFSSITNIKFLSSNNSPVFFNFYTGNYLSHHTCSACWIPLLVSSCHDHWSLISVHIPLSEDYEYSWLKPWLQFALPAAIPHHNDLAPPNGFRLLVSAKRWLWRVPTPCDSGFEHHFFGRLWDV